MNGTLVIPCVGAMQSWGTRSRFHDRDTEREPTKSGIVGLLCAALGRKRHEEVKDLTELKMSVRVDKEGRVARDYQTVMSKTKVEAIGYRHHLQDAQFLVALEGDFVLLKQIHDSLHYPVWQMYLGRKSYVPSIPFYVPNGLFEGKSVEILKSLPLLPSQKNASFIRIVTDALGFTNEVRQDVPISFLERTFAKRCIVQEMISVTDNFCSEVPLCIFHN